ncbi:MAG: hypothetical protein Q7T01_02830 [bacterium]|nr:hypothetical protein [bacterium]
MKYLKEPKYIIAVGVVLVVVVIGAAAWEKQARIDARTLAPRQVDLAAEERTALEQEIVAAEQELADEDDANDFNAYVKIALARGKLGDREGEAETYRTMNAKYPGNYLSYQNLGVLYQEDKKCDLAREQYLRAIENAPRIPHVYRSIVNLYTYDCQEYVHEIPAVLQGGLAIVPDSVDFMSMMAVYHRDFGNLEDAIHWLELILVFDQENASVLAEVKDLQKRLEAQRTGK